MKEDGLMEEKEGKEPKEPREKDYAVKRFIVFNSKEEAQEAFTKTEVMKCFFHPEPSMSDTSYISTGAGHNPACGFSAALTIHDGQGKVSFLWDVNPLNPQSVDRTREDLERIRLSITDLLIELDRRLEAYKFLMRGGENG